VVILKHGACGLFTSPPAPTTDGEVFVCYHDNSKSVTAVVVKQVSWIDRRQYHVI